MERRASAPAAIGVVGLTAVVVAAAVVLLAPRAAPEDSEPEGVETEVPTALADGRPLPDVPERLGDLADRPVVAVERLDDFPDGMSCDEAHMPWEDEPEVEAVFITPTAANGSLVGEGSFPHEPEMEQDRGPEAFRAYCRLVHEGGQWREAGSGGGSASEPGPPGTSRGSGSSCCAGGHGTAHADVSVAGDVAWLLQDRGPYWLAYPVDGLDVVTVEWPFPQSQMGGGMHGPPPSRVRLLDSDGNVIAERFVG